MGVSNAWATDFQGQGTNAGWISGDSDEGLILTWSKNSSTATTKMKYKSLSSGGDLGSITTGLKLTKIEAKFWRVYQYGNICSATIFWELYKGDTKIANDSEDCTSWGSWSGNNCTLSETLNLDFLAKTTGPGAYTIKVYGKLTGRSQNSKYDDPSYLGCSDNFWYNNNNSGSYSITFTIDPVVTFKANGGTGSDYTQTVTYNTSTALTANKFTRTGYSFNGWKTEANSGTSYADKANVTFKANTTLYAQWKEQTFHLTGYMNEWNTSSNPMTISDGKATCTLTLAKGQYDFKIVESGETWRTASTTPRTINRNSNNLEFKTKGGNNNNNTTFTADVEGTADYVFNYDIANEKLTVTYPAAYTVTYDVGTTKGTTSVTTNPSITSGSLVLASTSITFSKGETKAGYQWKNWNTNANGTGTELGTNETYTSSNRNANTTVYACYDLITYNITYNLNGGTGATNTTYNVESATITLPTAPTKNGYDFAGWYNNANFTGDKVTQVTKGSTGDKTFYAKWTPKEYSITYNNVDGVSHSNPATYTIESETITFTNPTSARIGYDFAGWNPASIETGSTSNKTVTAKWNPKTYTVNLNQEEATEQGTSSVTATYNAAMPKIDELPARTGYTFGGYFTEKNGGGTQYYNANGTSAKDWNIAEEDRILYAKWTANTYQVKFNGNGNTSGSMSNQSFTYDEEPRALTTNAFTRDGYTFAGWNTKEDGTGTKFTDGEKVQNLTANNNSIYNIYAQWTINQYTLTYSAGEGGSVTGTHESGAKLDYNTSVTLTATPTTGNVFAQWVNENGTTVSTDNPYTFNLTANKTIKAEFAPPTTVYLKPLDFWPSDNARFAIYIWEDDRNKWVEMESVDCEKQYYSANIPSGYTNFMYVRLNPAGKGDASKNDGLHFDYCWNQTGNLKVQEKMLYTTPRIYLKPNDYWKTDNARFAAYFFENGKEAKWMSMDYKDGDYYYCNMVEGYSKVIFCRMNPSTETNNFDNCWNQSSDQTIAGNCFTVTENTWNEGTWKEHHTNFTTPTYSVTIKPTIHGTYSVVCNGRAYPVTYKKDVVIPDVPMGTILTIQDVKPNKEAEYTDDIIYKESANAEYQKLVGNQITVCGNTTIDENFVTKNTHVVYLRIPNGLAWNTDDHQYLYAYDKLKDETVKLTAEPTPNNYEPGYTYYTCTIPAETHTIRFEYHSGGNTLYQTHDFPHVMPLGSLNCYTIHSKEGETSIFNGYWSELLSIDDYRLLYVEQVVEKDQNNKTVITRKKAHPSNIIKKRTETGTDTVSLHVYNQNTYKATYKWENEETSLTYDSPSNSAVILQQYDGSKWVDIQHHMVFGPLEAHVYTAMLPGRRNATAEDEPLVAQLKADYGIENIKNDDLPDKGNGVWNFPIKQTVNGANTTIELMRKDVHRYKGEYYIRTDVANGGWFNYNPTNHMTRSDEAKANSNFSHYYCKWVESENNVNVKFTVANDYGYAISDTLEADRTDLWGVALTQNDDEKMVDSSQKLPKNADVRFAWNEYSNFVHRAYIAGSAVVSDRFLVLEGDANIFDAKGNSLAAGVDNGTDPRFGLNANEEIFRDNSNWIYYADVQMKPMAPVKVTAKYDNHTQYFIGKQNETVTLLQGTGEEKYLIRMLYDFKTNQLISAYVPGASPDVHAISTNLMLIRQNNNEATQLIFNNETPSDMINIPTDRRAYGVIEFTEKRLINGKDDENKSLNEYEKSLYWISFPFNVDVSKAICFGEYGKHWIIQEYNGARRAAEGMWLDSETFWDYKWDQNITLEAGKGYVLALDVDQIASDGLFGLAGNRPIGIYFPSTEYISTAITEQTQVSTTVPAHVCTINRGTPKGDRRIADSHWNVIGVPSYVNAKGDYQLADIETQPEEVKYYYRWDGDFNAYTAMEKEGTKDFLSTHAYMVQFAGQINWQNIFNVNGVPKELAAKQSTDSEQEHRLRLELHQKGNKADHTFVRLQDEDGVTIRFDFNHDLCKVINAGANIYSVITAEESPVEVAANVIPIAETIIPVGVKITAAGEYTFRMPEGTDGIVVELIDYETNTRTNMLLDEYTVNLEKGTFDNRFALHVKPSKVTTSVGDINTNSNGVKKYLIDGILYMQKDGVLYDAQGKLVR